MQTDAYNDHLTSYLAGAHKNLERLEASTMMGDPTYCWEEGVVDDLDEARYAHHYGDEADPAYTGEPQSPEAKELSLALVEVADAFQEVFKAKAAIERAFDALERARKATNAVK